MKKLLSLLLLSAMLVMVFLPIPARADGIKRMSLSADKNSVESGNSVTFSCKFSGKSLAAKVNLKDESGNVVSPMYDDGTHGDEKAYDGVFSCRIKLESDKLCTRKYYASTGSFLTYPVSVKFRSEITAEDMEYAQDLWKKIESYENELAEMGLSAEEIMTSVYTLVRKDPHIYTIEKNSTKSFSFMLDSGVECYFEHFDNLRKDKKSSAQMRDMSYIQESSIGVWSPYYGTDSDFTEGYLERAQEMAQLQGYDSVDAYYGEDATLDSFCNFDKYGIIMIDSHGAEYDGGGYICVPNVTEYDAGDVADGLVVMSGKTALISGAFIAKYTDELPNSIIYIGICNGMQADNFYAPLLNHGAGFIAGFDESVSFTFDSIVMNDFCTRIASVDPNTGLQYTAGDAYKACIMQNGGTDIYAKPRAQFVWYGNPDVVAAAIETAVESVSFPDTQVILYHNNTYTPNLIILPENANRCISRWESDDDSIVTVDDNGTVKVGDKDGTAHIKCTVTDSAGGEIRLFFAELEVTVAGAMPVSGVSAKSSALTVYMGETKDIGAYVLPQNASEQGLVYSSFDENIAQVDELGNILPISVGETYIQAKSAASDASMFVAVNVREGDFDAALNKLNGSLSFSADGSYSPIVTTETGRLCVQSANGGKMNSTSTVTLSNIQMQSGDMLVFDWKTSCEAIYDSFKFTVNGELFEEMSGDRDWKTITYIAKEDGNFIFKWTYQKDYSTDINADCVWLDNVDIIRKDELHTVTFLDASGNILDVQTVAHGEAAAAPQVEANDLLICTGWDADFSEVRTDMAVTSHDVILGDANSDGVVNTGDAVIVLRICAELMQSDSLLDLVCDFNCDGKLNTGDATAVLKYVVMR